MTFKLVEPKAIAPSTITILRVRTSTISHGPNAHTPINSRFLLSWSSVPQALMYAGLTIGCEFSPDGDLLFVKIAASLKRLERHADVIDLALLADPSVLKEISKKGLSACPGIERGIKKFEIGHRNVVKYTPYEFIYLPYDTAEPQRDWFSKVPGTNTPLRPVERIKLIKSIIVSDVGKRRVIVCPQPPARS
jgi:hypothetical protein